MQVIFKNLSKATIENVTGQFGNDNWILFKEPAEDPEDDELYDVCIDDSIAVMKVLDERVQLDIGGTKVDISEYDFSEVKIV